MEFKKILKYYYSVKNLKPLQILFLVKNRVLKIEFKNEIIKGELKKIKPKTDFIYSKKSLFIKDNKKYFEFINKKIPFTNWNMEEEPLWRFNLHYFDYLMQKDMSKKMGLEFINSWIDYFDSNQHKKDALHSYPISLRIMNWIKFLNRFSINDKKIEKSILNQISYLFQNMEFDLMANHLLTNLLSLKFSLSFILGKRINFFIKIIDFLLKRELKEQINSDGLHYERSFMYSNIILEMILDIINITDDDTLKNIAQKMINTSSNFSVNNNIPLFNDAANNIASDLSDLLKYSSALGLKLKEKSDILILKKSNFVKYENGDIILWFDGGGDLKYQSGHIHSSALSFELYYKKKKIFTDIGCITYLNGENRNYLRATTSHNTISIDNKNQSEIWSAFRVAKRAKFYTVIIDENTIFSKVKGYEGYEHSRKIKFVDSRIIITDIIIFKGFHEFELTFNIAPENKINFENKSIILDKKISVFNDKFIPTIENTEYYPEFNKKINIKTIKYKNNFKNYIEFKTIISLEVK